MSRWFCPFFWLTVFLIAMGSVACSSNKASYSEPDDYAQQKSMAADQAPAATGSSTWNKAAAVSYLNQRESWWVQWRDAKRDNDTFCISCHTNLPFAFAQTALGQLSNDLQTAEIERLLIVDVRNRVRRWDSIDSYYGDKDDESGNGPGSRATESVLNATLLAYYDASTGQLSDDTRLAFKNMWALQQTSSSQQGAWMWQKFRLSPWESSESPYYGATLAALAVGVAPGDYRSTPEIQNHLFSLRTYLQREYANQSLLNRIGLLWAATKWPGLLTPDQQKTLIQDLTAKQQSDGGWSLSVLTWSPRYFGIPSFLTTRRRNDWTPQEAKSDGLATGYIAFVLEQAGVPPSNPAMTRAITWLVKNQNPVHGYWTAYSLNRKRDPSSDVGRFMTDAATAFAVLALNGQGS
jgi:squalene-hopene/tetraprenyl-beta-curcumene cyclase